MATSSGSAYHTGNVRPHMSSKHKYDIEARFQTLLSFEDYYCNLHKTSMKFMKRQELKQDLFFIHRGDDEQYLKTNKISKRPINKTGRECKGTVG